MDKVEARFYSKMAENACLCETCPRGCLIKPGKHGYCLSRENQGGRLISALYGQGAAMQMDPIEKKPLYHFLPGSKILSVGTIGCNLGCKFCQNWELSRGKSPTRTMSVNEVIGQAQANGSQSIAYTYNEPLIWYEFVYDCCKAAKKAGLNNVFVTNGTLAPDPFDELLPFIDALNVDLKGDAGFYRDLTDSDILPVKRNIEVAAQTAYVEITNLLVTGRNDSEKQIRELVDFVSGIGRKTPIHFSRYFPNYKFDAKPTPETSIERALEIAQEKLEFVYAGNISIEQGRDTVCPECKTVNISRSGYFTRINSVDENGTCANCGYDLNMEMQP